MNHLKIIFIGFLGQGIGLFQSLYLCSTTLKIEMINSDANEVRNQCRKTVQTLTKQVLNKLAISCRRY